MQKIAILALFNFAICVPAIPNVQHGSTFNMRAIDAGDAAGAADPCTFAAYETFLFTDSMSTFLEAKAAKDPGCFDWSDDGCSCSPDQLGDFDFLNSCQRHDFGYRNGKKLGKFDDALKERVDNNLKDDLYDVCSKFSGLESYKGVECRRIADLYVAAVKTFGKKKRDVEFQKRECGILG